ncbi:XRE family transcriptional regulator [Actinokineospora enzanensis]|uniref:XRE family transcriptional regulator n=1 Tax=Actinokineospora enzanensis TaxID=155975 RepID=UPI000376DF67|nr:XRE family transcriptional regulator [Actinokineospora enzanensis]
MSSEPFALASAFDPPRLTMARRLAGRSAADLAATLGHPVERYELGQVRPTADVVRACARVLGVEPGFFTAGRPRLHLDLERTSLPRGAERTAAFLELLWEVLCVLNEQVELPDAALFPPGKPAAPARAAIPTALAHKVRLDWCARGGPLHRLVGRLEGRGIIVVPFAGAPCVADLPGHTVITVDPRQPVAERRWATAEQFGHLLYGVDTCARPSAVAFGAELLLPCGSLVAAEIRRDPVEVATRFGVPVARLLHRARALRLVGTAVDPPRAVPDGDVPDDEVPRLLAEAAGLAFTDPVPELADRLFVTPRLMRALLSGSPAVPDRHLAAVR